MTDRWAIKVVFQTLNYKPCPENEAPARFGFECPRKPGYMCGGLLIAGADLGGGAKAIEGKRPPCWKWDGNRTAPTFSPSIHCLAHNPTNPKETYGGCGWHGHIQKGMRTGK